jgi:MoaA/NifB/PqqE/SkfB family radical SAM enzyme
MYRPGGAGMLTSPKRSLTSREVLAAWARILGGRVPLLSIEITKECPLQCPGCYAYGNMHLGGDVTLGALSDLQGNALVEGVLQLVQQHKPMHVSLVGGEPLIRHRELSRILPALGRMGVFTLVVTSAVVPIPKEWMKIPRLRVAVSVDGLPEDHDIRRKPATYQRILKNIEGREVNIHWVITSAALKRPSYLEEYLTFWNAQPEVNRIWVSLYTPQLGEQSPENLGPEDRRLLVLELPTLTARFPKLLMTRAIAATLIDPPNSPDNCLFAKMSLNFSADLSSQVEPCIFGGTPDCSQCGCAISSALHWLRTLEIAGPLKITHFIEGSIGVGLLMKRFRSGTTQLPRWERNEPRINEKTKLVQIQS